MIAHVIIAKQYVIMDVKMGNVYLNQQLFQQQLRFQHAIKNVLVLLIKNVVI